MRRLSSAYIVGLLLFSAAFFSGVEVMADNGWGETVGPVYAIVRGADGPGGLSVRAAPYERGPILGHLDVGTKIRAYNRFTNGWVQIRTHIPSGWVRIDQLEPFGGEAVVSGIDRPEGCLRIRSGPSTATEVIGCVNLGETLWLTGIWSEDPWAQVAKPVPGWVYTPQILSSLSPPDEPTTVAYSRPPPRIYVDSSPTYYSSIPFWTGLLFRSLNYPYWKHRRSFRHYRYYPGHKTWKYPGRKFRRHVRHYRGNNNWRNPARTYRYNVRRSLGNATLRYGNRNWSVRAGRRNAAGFRAGRRGNPGFRGVRSGNAGFRAARSGNTGFRAGRRGNMGFRAARRGNMGFRGGRRGFASSQMGGFQARGRRR